MTGAIVVAGRNSPSPVTAIRWRLYAMAEKWLKLDDSDL